MIKGRADDVDYDTERSTEENEEYNDEDHIASVSYSWWLAMLLGLFGLSSWVAVNSLWMELPLLVNVLPERWNLPAYLSIIIQLANFAPLLYVLLTRICRAFVRNPGSSFVWLIQPPERLTNYIILIVGLVASLLLTKFWNVVVVVPGLPPNTNMGDASSEAIFGHSIGLFVLTFSLGMIDCMSSVTYLAYLANMPAAYAGALLFGETCSGLVPSLLALVQGATSEPICHNKTVNGSSHFEAVYPEPRFSVSVFMGMMACITLVSLIAFFLLDCLPRGLGRSVTLAYQQHHSLPQQPLEHGMDSEMDSVTEVAESTTDRGGIQEESKTQVVESMCGSEKYLFALCFLLTGYASCLMNGLLPSLQSFSTAAYDTTTFHLAVTLSGLVSPIVAIVMTTVYGYGEMGLCLRGILSSLCCKRRAAYRSKENEAVLHQTSTKESRERMWWQLLLLSLLATIPSAYIVFLAAASPTPPLMQGFGPVLAVLAWMGMYAGFTGQRTWITLHLVKNGSQRQLRVLGIATQTGSLVGALISFLLTAQYNMFTSKMPCV